MALYAFYPCKPDGTSESFLTFELIDDEDAHSMVPYVLQQHPSAVEVAVWCGDRKVSIRRPTHPDLRALLSRPQAS